MFRAKMFKLSLKPEKKMSNETCAQIMRLTLVAHKFLDLYDDVLGYIGRFVVSCLRSWRSLILVNQKFARLFRDPQFFDDLDLTMGRPELVFPKCKELVAGLRSVKLISVNESQLRLAFSTPCQLHTIVLVDCLFSLRNINFLAGMTTLKSLRLQHCLMVSDLDVGLDLHHLTLTGCDRISDASLDPVFRMSNLRTLTLHRLSITDTSFTRLEHLRSLHTLNLCYLDITDATLVSLEELPSLQTLNLEGCARCTAQGLRALWRITELGLSKWDQLTDLSTIPSTVTALDLSQCEWLMDLRALQAPGLQKLNILACADVQNVDHLSCMHQLTDLCLANCRHVSRLPPFTALQRLDLSHCTAITDEVLLPANLTVLDLKWTAVTDLVLRKSISQMNMLQELCLSGTSITNEGLLHLESLRSLERLVLNHVNGITVECLPMLWNLPKLTCADMSNSRRIPFGFWILRK